jgi:hypothetical protein
MEQRGARQSELDSGATLAACHPAYLPEHIQDMVGRAPRPSACGWLAAWANPYGVLRSPQGANKTGLEERITERSIRFLQFADAPRPAMAFARFHRLVGDECRSACSCARRSCARSAAPAGIEQIRCRRRKDGKSDAQSAQVVNRSGEVRIFARVPFMQESHAGHSLVAEMPIEFDIERSRQFSFTQTGEQPG